MTTVRDNLNLTLRKFAQKIRRELNLNSLTSGGVISPSITGSESASGTLTLNSTSDSTKGKILFGTSAYNESNNRLGLLTTTPVTTFHIDNGSGSITEGADPVMFIDAGTNAYAAEFTAQGLFSGFIITNSNASGVPFIQMNNSGNAKVWSLTLNTDNTVSIREGNASSTARFTLGVGGGLDIPSTTKAFLPPRMTKAQRNAISSPAAGSVVYQTDNTPGLRVYNSTHWVKFTETNDD